MTWVYWLSAALAAIAAILALDSSGLFPRSRWMSTPVEDRPQMLTNGCFYVLFAGLLAGWAIGCVVAALQATP